jgi:hypothetical protein
MAKVNCWEFKKCGREPGGSRVDELGACPAAQQSPLDSVHAGRNAGRTCWVVAGTLCGSKIQGSFAAKYDTCKNCDFYQLVQKDEYPEFKLAGSLLALLRR